jgi:hypothetical protein
MHAADLAPSMRRRPGFAGAEGALVERAASHYREDMPWGAAEAAAEIKPIEPESG